MNTNTTFLYVMRTLNNNRYLALDTEFKHVYNIHDATMFKEPIDGFKAINEAGFNMTSYGFVELAINYDLKNSIVNNNYWISQVNDGLIIDRIKELEDEISELKSKLLT